MQETMLAAWRSLARFEGRASIRTWLYRIATNRCLNVLRSASRRPQEDPPFAGLGAPQPNQTGEVVWLEPYPDVLLEGLADPAPGPEARYETREAISLAFVTALQLLPPRQRAALVLRDVLGFRASEAAHILDTTQESVTSALKRARAALDRKPASGEAPPRAGSPEEQRLVERMVRALPGQRPRRPHRAAQRRRLATHATHPSRILRTRPRATVLRGGRLPPGAHLPPGRRPGPTSSPPSASTSPTCTPPRFTRVGCSC